MQYNPLLVAVEGIDASGKLTQTTRLAEAVVGKRFAFPEYDTQTGKRILEMLKSGDPDPLTLQAMMVANKYEHAYKIRRHLQNHVVVCDRYIMSALAYGGVSGLDTEWLWRLHDSLPMPDIHILLDINVEESFRRRPVRTDAYEANKERLEKVTQEYRWWWAKRVAHRSWQGYRPHWYKLDGTLPPDDLHERILTIIKNVSNGVLDHAAL